MDITEKIDAYEFMAEPFHCDFSKSLFLGHLGNHMLNAADFHATRRGFGMTELNPVHKTWVLSRLAIEMTKMPKEYARFNVETWIESAMKYFTNRNFRVVDAVDNNMVYGYGRSIWAMIDTETRQPADILAVRDGAIAKYADMDKTCPIDVPSRVKMTAKAQLVASVETHYSDVDVNGHINSVKYIEHVLNLFDISWHKEHKVSRIDIAYVAESHCGDRLDFYREDMADGAICVRIVKVPPHCVAGADVCRCRIEF